MTWEYRTVSIVLRINILPRARKLALERVRQLRLGVAPPGQTLRVLGRLPRLGVLLIPEPRRRVVQVLPRVAVRAAAPQRELADLVLLLRPLLSPPSKTL